MACSEARNAFLAADAKLQQSLSDRTAAQAAAIEARDAATIALDASRAADAHAQLVGEQAQAAEEQVSTDVDKFDAASAAYSSCLKGN